MKVTIEENELVIRLPLEEPTPSASGKTLLVAGTHGSHVTDVMVSDKLVTVSANAYISKH
jgi:hypothetical protein